MKKTISLLFFISFVFAAFAQEASHAEKKGNKLFHRFDYLKAIDKYKAIENLSMQAQRKLAESYRMTNQMPEAEQIYASLATNENSTKEDLYYYSYVLKENKKYQESNLWMEKYEVKNEDLRTEHYQSDKAKLNAMLLDNGTYQVHNVDLNTNAEDFGTSYRNDKVVFASSREGVKWVKRTWAGNHKSFLDLYTADQSNNQLQNIQSLGKFANKKYHEGPASFALNDNFIAYTSNNYKGKSSDGTIKLKIFFSEFKSGEWSEPLAFFLNNNQYSVGHPCLSADGNVMYFASDLPGGFGGVDIYKVTRENGNEWSQPINLGVEVNTEGNEMFPFYHENSKILYFASDGQFGLGGLDVFASPLQSDKFLIIKNLGSPINSERDDFALILDKEATNGYFSSNRIEGKGGDDIYSFKALKALFFGKQLIGVSKDKNDSILSNTTVYLFNNTGALLDSTVTDDQGTYQFMVEPDKDFVLKGVKSKYFEGNTKASSKTPNEVIVADVQLEKDLGLSLYVLVTDKKTQETISGVLMTITNNKTGKVEEKALGKISEYLTSLSTNKLNDKISYSFKLEAPGYLGKTVTYNQLLDKEGRYDVHKTVDFALDKIIAGETKLEDLIAINPIYFDLNKDFIRKDAAIELDKIVQVMNENPTMVVELGSHTDCRASFVYNENLSDRRAKSSAKYIAAKITDPSRIYGKGYGEGTLLNTCACEGTVKSTCTEEEHQKNRRTEFKILKFDAPNTKIINNSTDSFGK